jgi:tripeptide aminopeptidase
LTFSGCNVHPGYAKDKMLNSLLVANEFIAMLPKNETPETTEGYEGFYHLISVEGSVEKTAISYIIRDHDIKIFEKRKENMLTWVEKINAKYGNGTVKIELKDQYYNMREKVEPVKHVIDIAYKAMKDAGVEPKVKPIRGGTDGAQLSFKGLPCPNIFAGGINFHGKFEFVPVQSMEKAMNVIIKIVEETANR